MQLKNTVLTFLTITLSACSNDDNGRTDEIPAPELPVYTVFTDEGEMNITGSDPTMFSANSLRIKGIHSLLPTITLMTGPYML